MNEPSQLTSSVLSVRVTPNERIILEAAAAHSRASLSEFIRRKAIEAAEGEMLDRSIVTIPAKDWERFEEWMAKPAQTIPALERLASRPFSWDQSRT